MKQDKEEDLARVDGLTCRWTWGSTAKEPRLRAVGRVGWWHCDARNQQNDCPCIRVSGHKGKHIAANRSEWCEQ